MIGTTHTIRRIATGLTLAAAAAALAVPAALGGAYWPAGGFVTDTVDSARVAAYGPPDPWLYPYIDSGRAASLATTYGLPSGVATDTLDTARVAQPQIVGVVSQSFDWGDFAIGIGAGIGGLLGLGALATGAGRLRQPRHRLGSA